MKALRVLCFVLLFLAFGCATVPDLPPRPARPGHEWIKVSTGLQEYWTPAEDGERNRYFRYDWKWVEVPTKEER